MANRMTLSSDQQAVLTAVGDLEANEGRAPTLAEVAGDLDWPRTRVREVLSTLLSDEADLLRELPTDEPDEAAYELKQRPA